MQHSRSHAIQIDAVFATPLMKREDETLYDYCLSFSPAAPFFGVPYRFAEMFKPAAMGEMSPKSLFAGFTMFSPAKGDETIVEPPVEAEAIVEEVAEVIEETVEAAEDATETAVEAAEEVTETVAEATEEAVEETAETSSDLFGAAVEAGSAAPATLYDAAPAVIDDLKLLKGVGPKLEAELNALGIYTFAQIAEMTDANLEWLDEQISSVRGRPMRDDWAGQAKALAGL